MKIYRFEHENSRLGPYRHVSYEDGRRSPDDLIFLCNSLMNFGERKNRHPCPSQDDNLKIEPHHIFGCYRLEDLVNYFRHYIYLYKNWQFVIAEYEVPDEFVQRGKFEVVFDPSKKTSRKVIEVNLSSRGKLIK